MQQYSLERGALYYLFARSPFVPWYGLEKTGFGSPDISLVAHQEWDSDCHFDSAEYLCGPEFPDGQASSRGRGGFFPLGLVDPLACVLLDGKVRSTPPARRCHSMRGQ